jgi:hypothetical protein
VIIITGIVFVTTIANVVTAQEACELGEMKWIVGCYVERTTGKRGGARTCTGSPPPGFVMLEWKAKPTSVNNGDITLSALGGKVSWREDIERAYRNLQDDIVEGQFTYRDGMKVDGKLSAKLQEDAKSASKLSAMKRRIKP